MVQKILFSRDGYDELTEWLESVETRHIFVVHDDSLKYMDELQRYLKGLGEEGINISYFSDFNPNPEYGSVVEAVKKYRVSKCDTIMAIGGGSAIDVAKCVKLYEGMDGTGEDGSFLTQMIPEGRIPFIVMPTTAGTGSEATLYAVIYYNGEKQSITSDYCIPDAVLMDPNALKTLPLYQKKATMCDALCHGIESYWSVNSTDESKKYSREAIKGVLENMEGYLANTDEGNAGMLMAAHKAGQAINITQTTAGHAMCYKITGLFGIAHGHAAILCNRVLFKWMIGNLDKCIDTRGRIYLEDILKELGIILGGQDAISGSDRLVEIFERLSLDIPRATKEQFEILKNSVNSIRLKNHPIHLSESEIDELYHSILDNR